MGVTANLRQIYSRLKSAEIKVSDSVLSALDIAGLEIVNVARRTKTYEDRTGDLSASIGYGVYTYGKAYSIGGFLGGQGEQSGQQKLIEIAGLYTHSRYVLLVVAGMEYAAYVERKGYIVLDAAKLQADSIIANALNNIKLEL